MKLRALIVCNIILCSACGAADPEPGVDERLAETQLALFETACRNFADTTLNGATCGTDCLASSPNDSYDHSPSCPNQHTVYFNSTASQGWLEFEVNGTTEWPTTEFTCENSYMTQLVQYFDTDGDMWHTHDSGYSTGVWNSGIGACQFDHNVVSDLFAGSNITGVHLASSFYTYTYPVYDKRKVKSGIHK